MHDPRHHQPQKLIGCELCLGQFCLFRFWSFRCECHFPSRRFMFRDTVGSICSSSLSSYRNSALFSVFRASLYIMHGSTFPLVLRVIFLPTPNRCTPFPICLGLRTFIFWMVVRWFKYLRQLRRPRFHQADVCYIPFNYIARLCPTHICSRIHVPKSARAYRKHFCIDHLCQGVGFNIFVASRDCCFLNRGLKCVAVSKYYSCRCSTIPGGTICFIPAVNFIGHQKAVTNWIDWNWIIIQIGDRESCWKRRMYLLKCLSLATACSLV